MNKLFFLFAVFSLNILVAREPTLVILRSVSSNSIQKFSIGMESFECKPYGIVAIDDLYKNASMDSNCKKKVEEFYKRDPNSKFFSSNVLKIMQMYHLEFKDKGCVLYANGQTTLSEMLLAKGLAFIKKGFKDDEFHTLFYKVQGNAKLSKIGLWEENILKDCMVESYKE